MAKKKTKKPPRKNSSWLTTDDEQREIRRERALSETMSIRALTDERGFFDDYAVARKGEPGEQIREYIVEFRSFKGVGNYCTCPDFAKNFLGTCKHIEKVHARHRRQRKQMGASPFVEVYTKADEPHQCYADLSEVRVPEAAAFIKRFFTAYGAMRSPVADVLPAFLRHVDSAPIQFREEIRISRSVRLLAERLEETEANHRARLRFGESFDKTRFLRFPLYDYQCQGLMHLAFNGRAMLTDEMGLGKTVQAIAACKALRDLRRIRRVLIVCPASLKAEWEEQIRTFTNLACRIVYGQRKARLEIYQKATEFFIVTNYEQILRDEEEINEFLCPDAVILDEAQRIKNWKTKTAQSIKRLESRYAFVLTGTPLENRIDEVYSIAEFIDPTILGSLFRFNREFYQFDEDGKMRGMRNLRRLHERLSPIMLRRRKSEINDQLPERVDNNYFVPMTPEQKKRYADYEYQVSILSNIASQRPLTPAEFERLQLCLACMRMLCDTVYILDPKVRDCPKIDELEQILADIWSDEPNRKVIVFSEWVRVLDLLKERLDDGGISYGWHVGKVPQHKRREEINRFKNDPECRVFLSSDSGSVGLNLQVASVVVNMDLPWNPAKLEQRIARAWRKHQRNTVNVINLVAEKTIEHRMLDTLRFKQKLADGVLDGTGDLVALEQPKEEKKSAFMERLGDILKTDFAAPAETEETAATPTPPTLALPPPATRFRQELAVSLAGELDLCKASVRPEDESVDRILAVSRKPDAARERIGNLLEKTGHAAPQVDVTVLSMEEYALLRQLAGKGVIAINDASMQELVQTEAATPPQQDDAAERAEACEPILKQSRRQLKMASVLLQGGFPVEATAPARKALDILAPAIAILSATAMPDKLPDALAALDKQQIASSNALDPGHCAFLATAEQTPAEDDQAETYVASSLAILEHLEKQRLSLLM